MTTKKDYKKALERVYEQAIHWNSLMEGESESDLDGIAYRRIGAIESICKITLGI